jgi:hypothetical protein
MLRLLLLTLPLLAAGCVVHGHGPHAHVHGPVVSIEAGHIHDDACGHYYWGGRWYHARHAHGPGCGHHYRGGMWIHVD